MNRSRLPQASMLCREESVATLHGSLAKARPGMLPLPSLLVEATLQHHQPLDVLLRLKILCRATVCLAKTKTGSPCQKGRGKEKPKHELISQRWRIKAGFVLPRSNQVRARDSSLFWASTARVVLYAVLPTSPPQITKLSLFLKNSFGWCSDQVFKHRWKPM